MFQWPKYLSPKCYSSSSKCQLLPILLLDHYLCVCVHVRACMQVPSCLSNSINRCTYTPPLQKPCLFTMPHKLLTLWTSVWHSLTFNHNNNNRKSPPFTNIHKQPFAPSLATCQVFFQQPKYVIISLIQNLLCIFLT